MKTGNLAHGSAMNFSFFHSTNSRSRLSRLPLGERVVIGDFPQGLIMKLDHAHPTVPQDRWIINPDSGDRRP